MYLEGQDESGLSFLQRPGPSGNLGWPPSALSARLGGQNHRQEGDGLQDLRHHQHQRPEGRRGRHLHVCVTLWWVSRGPLRQGGRGKQKGPRRLPSSAHPSPDQPGFWIAKEAVPLRGSLPRRKRTEEGRPTLHLFLSGSWVAHLRCRKGRALGSRRV